MTSPVVRSTTAYSECSCRAARTRSRSDAIDAPVRWEVETRQRIWRSLATNSSHALVRESPAHSASPSRSSGPSWSCAGSSSTPTTLWTPGRPGDDALALFVVVDAHDGLARLLVVSSAQVRLGEHDRPRPFSADFNAWSGRYDLHRRLALRLVSGFTSRVRRSSPAKLIRAAAVIASWSAEPPSAACNANRSRGPLSGRFSARRRRELLRGHGAPCEPAATATLEAEVKLKPRRRLSQDRASRALQPARADLVLAPLRARLHVQPRA